MDENRLLKYAIDYLSKYDSSKNNLINVLKRKIFRLKLSNVEKNILFKNIDSILYKLEQNNFLNDNRFCSSKILSLSNSGKSKKFIFNYLLKKGLNKIDIQYNLNKFQHNNDDWELKSAKLFIKKKRFFETKMSYEKKLAKMSRAGFSYDICKKILS